VFPRPDRIIVPQYEPPTGLSLIACAALLGESKRAVAAELVDLAVGGVLGVRRGSARRAGFELRLLRVPTDDGTASVRDDLDVLTAVFPARRPGATATLAPGTRRALGQRLREAHRMAVARLIRADLVRERGFMEKLVVFWRKQPTEPTSAAQPHVDALWGLYDYIAWAEADRLAFHQSPSGATVRQLDGVGMLHLHERLLPYAVLFGLEKQWMRELDLRHEAARAELGEVVDGVGVAVQLASAAVDVVRVVSDLPGLPDSADLPDFGDLGSFVDLGDAAEGAGAFFGGLGEFLGGIDL
jgi:hypothetical protein